MQIIFNRSFSVNSEQGIFWFCRINWVLLNFNRQITIKAGQSVAYRVLAKNMLLAVAVTYMSFFVGRGKWIKFSQYLEHGEQPIPPIHQVTLHIDMLTNNERLRYCTSSITAKWRNCDDNLPCSHVILDRLHTFNATSDFSRSINIGLGTHIPAQGHDTFKSFNPDNPLEIIIPHSCPNRCSLGSIAAWAHSPSNHCHRRRVTANRNTFFSAFESQYAPYCKHLVV